MGYSTSGILCDIREVSLSFSKGTYVIVFISYVRLGGSNINPVANSMPKKAMQIPCQYFIITLLN